MKSKRLANIPGKHRKAIEGQISGLLRMIQDRREKLGLSQEQFAEKLEISTEAVRSIEQGRRFPSLPMLFHILNTLNIDFSLK